MLFQTTGRRLQEQLVADDNRDSRSAVCSISPVRASIGGSARGVTELRELRRLREENGRLKTPGGRLALDRQILQEIVSKNVWSAA